MEAYRLGQDIWFEGSVAGEGITAAEIAKLARIGHLRLGYALHSWPIDHTTLEFRAGNGCISRNEESLRYRLSLQWPAFARQASSLLHFTFFYEGLGSFDEWGIPGTWAVVSLHDVDPVQAYFNNFNIDRS